MGNNRQILKDNLTKNLKCEIEGTADLLNKLRESGAIMEKSAADAKVEVDHAVNVIMEQLLTRKAELNKQIDTICQTHITSLRDWIDAAHLRLGQLQGTLNNLDSIEGAQLGQIRIPKAMWTTSPTFPSCAIRVETNEVVQEIKNWGSVVLNEAIEEPVVEAEETVIEAEMDQTRQTPALESENQAPKSMKRKLQPLFPPNFFADYKKETATLPEKDPSTQIEHWLSGINIQSSPSSDDTFEHVYNPVETRRKYSLGHSRKISEGEGSSIVCVEAEDMDIPAEMSKWLKAKKSNNGANQFQNEPETFQPMLTDLTNHVSSSSSETQFKPNSNKKKNHPLDFPCLKLDSNSWIHPKKSKKLSSCSNFSSSNIRNFIKSQPQLCLQQVGQAEIIPPNYALPYPFWLKKH